MHCMTCTALYGLYYMALYTVHVIRPGWGGGGGWGWSGVTAIFIVSQIFNTNTPIDSSSISPYSCLIWWELIAIRANCKFILPHIFLCDPPPGADPGGEPCPPPPFSGEKIRGPKNHTHRKKKSKSDNHEARHRLKRTPKHTKYAQIF